MEYGSFKTFIGLHMKRELHIQLFSWFLFILNQKFQIHKYVSPEMAVSVPSLGQRL